METPELLHVRRFGEVGAFLVAVVLPTLLVLVISALAVALVLSIADQAAGDSAGGSANGSAFQAPAALVPDDSADSSTTEATQGGTHVGIRTGAGNDTARNGSKDEHFYFFHLMSWFWVLGARIVRDSNGPHDLPDGDYGLKIQRNDEKNAKFQKSSPSPAEKLSTAPLALAA